MWFSPESSSLGPSGDLFGTLLSVTLSLENSGGLFASSTCRGGTSSTVHKGVEEGLHRQGDFHRGWMYIQPSPWWRKGDALGKQTRFWPPQGDPFRACGTFLSSRSVYLFHEVFGRPGFVIGRSLLLLPPLSLLQAVFVLRGLVDVPVLQGFGHMLPQPPGTTSTRTH